MTLPILDLRQPDELTAPLLATACEQIGFFLVRGHGIPTSLLHRMSTVTRKFFDLAGDQKRSAAAQPGVDRGYRGLGAGSLARSAGAQGAPDLRENFFVGPPELPTGKLPSGYFAPNVWPDGLAGMSDVCIDYYGAMRSLANRLLMLSARALDLPETYFEPYNTAPISQLTIVNYPEQTVAPQDCQLRASAHTDFGALTLLLAEDKPGGLQVLQHNGEWLNVAPPEPESYIVNIGDLMARWTNDRWKSTVHRVVNPPPATAAGSRRQSIVFFHHPDEDAVIECLPTCQSASLPARYEPTTPGQHLREKLTAVYGRVGTKSS
jgi:isopenicillin N synthase-like dioxygenase